MPPDVILSAAMFYWATPIIAILDGPVVLIFYMFLQEIANFQISVKSMFVDAMKEGKKSVNAATL